MKGIEPGQGTLLLRLTSRGTRGLPISLRAIGRTDDSMT